MSWKTSHTQQPQLRKIDLTRLKSMTEEEWAEVVDYVPFMSGPNRYQDYLDTCNLHMTNYIFKPRCFATAKEAGMTMLRTLNFMNK